MESVDCRCWALLKGMQGSCEGMQGSFEGTRTASCYARGEGGCSQACYVSGNPVPGACSACCALLQRLCLGAENERE